MAKVSTDGMRGTAGEIKSLIDVLKNKATSTAMGAERMSQAASVLTGYDGQIVQGRVVNTNQYDGKHVSHYKEYQTWIINTNGVEELASSVAKKAEALGTIASKISGEADVINSISEQIDGYIATIQSTIGDNVSATAAATAFKALGQNGVTKANLAVSGDLVNNRDFLDFNQIKKDSNLQGGVLTFEKQEDGTYKVLKNGGETGYYTTGLAAAFYMKTLTTSVVSENKTKISALENEAIDKLEDISENTPNIKSGTYTKAASKATEKKENTQATNNVSTGFEKIKQGVSNTFDETKENISNMRKVIDEKDLSGKTRTIDEFKTSSNLTSSSNTSFGTKEEYYNSDGTKSIFKPAEFSTDTVMEQYSKNGNLLSVRHFDETGKQTTALFYNESTGQPYRIYKGNIVEARGD